MEDRQVFPERLTAEITYQLTDAWGGLFAEEFLNASHASLWAVVSNGLKLRVLRDNTRLIRLAHIEADLGVIISEGLYPDYGFPAQNLWFMLQLFREYREQPKRQLLVDAGLPPPGEDP